VAVTVTNVEDNCRCENALQKQLCDVNVELGNQRWCVEKEDSSENTEVEAAEAAAVTEAAATTGANDSCRCCNVLQKWWCDDSVKRGKQRWCVEEEDSSENTEAEAATAAAGTEAVTVTETAVVTEATDSCRCCNDLQKFWCDEFLKLRHRRRCLERKDSVEETENSEEKTEGVNHFRIVWEKDGIL